MQTQTLLRDRRFVLAAISVVVVVMILLTARILLVDNPQANTLVSDLATVICVAIALTFFSGVWIFTSNKDISKGIWGYMAVGLALWTIAEATWTYYEVILGQEVPYPSLADLFWLLGYLPIYLALLTQYRIFQTAHSRQHKALIALLVAVFSLVVSVFVLKPNIEGFDPERILESLLNIAYPLFDLVLLILTVVIIFSLEQGRFALIWRLLGLGLVVMTVADLLFSYASWYAIYNPEGQPNAITVIIDISYYASYLILGLGAYTYRLTSESLPAVKFNIVWPSMAKSNILVFINRQGQIISLSDNFLDLIGGQNKSQYVKMPLNEALGIEIPKLETLLRETLELGSLNSQPLGIKDARENAKDIWVTSFVLNDEKGQFICIALVLRTDLDLQGQPERPLTEEQKLLIHYYLDKAGTLKSEENQVIRNYFLEQVTLLYSLIGQFSGTKVADRLLSHLDQIAARNHWQFTFAGHDITIPQEYGGQLLAERLCTLLQEAKSFSANLTNLNVVEGEMKTLDKHMSADILRIVDTYNLRSLPTSAS